MELVKQAVAGTMESSDIMITIEPSNESGLTIDLDSSVEKQFGHQIRAVIQETLDKLGVADAKVKAVDQGALDCTVQARTIAAVYRAAERTDYNWKEIGTWNV